MPSKKQEGIPVSSLVKKLEGAREEGLTFLTRGYVSEANEKVVRMYFDLSLDTYAEIPRSAVVHAQTIDDDKHEQAELMIMGNAPINVVHRQSIAINAGQLQQLAQDQKNQAKGISPGGSLSTLGKPAAPDPCAEPEPACACGGQQPVRVKPAQPSAAASGPDPLREAAKWALGPFGMLL